MDLDLKIEYQALDTLTVGPTNRRQHSPRQLKKLAKGVRRHGFMKPIIVDHDGRIVAILAGIPLHRLFQHGTSPQS